MSDDTPTADAAFPAEPTRAGAVVLREVDGATKVLLVTRKNTVASQGQWVPPLGGIEPGESPAEAAARETAEEAGIAVRVGEPVGDLTWHDPRKGPQRCRFFRARYDRDTDWPEAHKRDRAWLDADHAARHVIDFFAPVVRNALTDR